MWVSILRNICFRDKFFKLLQIQKLSGHFLWIEASQHRPVVISLI